ncbi:MAG: flagellar protein FlgN [Planctomycetaceae bacterium]|nr:flagellar protein FlgN [Planctomycetaceae bacterium]
MISMLEEKLDTMNEHVGEQPWEEDLAALLNDLSQVQDDLLDVLARKRQCMAVADIRGMQALQPVEEALGQRLQACHDRRAALLADAEQQGLPGHSLGELATALQRQGGSDLRRDVRQTSARMRLLQHQSLTNWVLAQKAVLHIAQLLEILATGGRLKPTYGKDAGPHDRGALVDQQV